MKKILLLLIFVISIYANDDLSKERELELKMYSDALNIKDLTNDCKSALKDIIKKTIENNKDFDNFIKYNSNTYSITYKKSSDTLSNSKKYLMIICNDNDLKLIRESTTK